MLNKLARCERRPSSTLVNDNTPLHRRAPRSARLKNIEETEKAKRLIAEEKQGRKLTDEEAHLVATRCASVSRVWRGHFLTVASL